MDISASPSHAVDPLLVVANTRHGPGGHYHARPAIDEGDHDHLDLPDRAYAFLVDHGVRPDVGTPDEPTLAALRAIRDVVRSLAGDPDPRLRGEHGPSTEQAMVEDLVADRIYRLDPRGRPAPLTDGWPGFIDGLMPALLELRAAPGDVRACANPACRFVFRDRSRNRSRLWCESAYCGNRIRVGRHRQRQAATTSADPRPER